MPASILAHLPHRSPFLLVDRVLERQAGIHVVAEKHVGPSDPVVGDPGGAPGLPAPLLLEMLAQAAGFLEAGSLHGQQIYLAGIQDARFHGTARTGDVLRLEVKPEAAFGAITRIAGEVRRDGALLCSASLLLRRGGAAP